MTDNEKRFIKGIFSGDSSSHDYYHTIRVYKLAMDIQIKMFDDHIVVESPGKLLGLVRADNIRFTHFSRNPKIAEFLCFSYKTVMDSMYLIRVLKCLSLITTE